MWQLLGKALGPYYSIASGTNMPNNSLGDINALAKAYGEAHAKKKGSLGAYGPPAPPPPSPPISTSNYTPAPPAAPAPQANPSAPSVPAQGGLGLYPPQNATPMNWLQSAQQMPPTSPSPPTPMPQARPAGAPQAPQAPQINPNGSIAGATGPTSVGGAPLVAQNAPTSQPNMSFFQRNAAMMQDPMTGQFIDPTGAAQAQSQVRGPDLINQMLALLKSKAST